MTHEMTTDELLANWFAAQQAATAAVELERKLRVEIAKKLFAYSEDQLQKGTKSTPIANGYKAKVTFHINKSVEQQRVSEALHELQELGVPQEIRNQVFKFKADLSETGYKMLSQPAKDVVDCIVSRKPGLPSLEIVSPKVAK